MSVSESNIITFGKHKGEAIEDIYRDDTSYARYIFQNMDEETPQGIRDFLADKFDAGDTSYLLNWGKFKGQTLDQVYAKAPSYIAWLRKSAFVIEKCPRLRAELASYESNP